MKPGTWSIIHFVSRGDERGELVALQGNHEIPFEIKRVYYIIETLQDVVRGLHAHRNLEQVLIAVAGSCRVSVNDGKKTEEFVLNNCRTGLRISNLVWREMRQFSADCVLLVLASERYDPSDYIRDFNQFQIESKAALEARAEIS